MRVVAQQNWEYIILKTGEILHKHILTISDLYINQINTYFLLFCAFLNPSNHILAL